MFRPCATFAHSSFLLRTGRRFLHSTDRHTTAACLVIGNEILNGTVNEANIQPLAQTLYSRGVQLKRVEVIGDEEDSICEAVARVGSSVDYLFTTGGIGSTHDDITYSALAKAYNSSLKADPITEELLTTALTRRGQQMTEARRRMCIFPANSTIYRSPKAMDVLEKKEKYDALAHKIHPRTVKDTTFWVPLVVVDHRCFVFPGVPHIFRSMLEDFEAALPSSSFRKMMRRDLFIQMPEGELAELLGEVEQRFRDSESPLQIGSYPERISSEEKYQVRISLQSSSEEVLQAGEDALREAFPAFQNTPFGALVV